MKKTILIFTIFIWSHSVLAFRPFIIRSGKSQVHLIEYYDSESCTTCDDQRKWLSDLRSDKKLFKKFIPVAFDVEKNADRLKELSLDPSPDGATIAIDGVGWTWTTDSKIPDESTEVVGELEVARAKFQEFEVTFTPKEKFGPDRKVKITGVLLGNGSKEFSVIEISEKELKKIGSSFTGHLKFSMKKKPEFKTYTAVFWVSKDDDFKPIQAVGANLTID
jgi:hypothetical protein